MQAGNEMASHISACGNQTHRELVNGGPDAAGAIMVAGGLLIIVITVILCAAAHYIANQLA